MLLAELTGGEAFDVNKLIKIALHVVLLFQTSVRIVRCSRSRL